MWTCSYQDAYISVESQDTPDPSSQSVAMRSLVVHFANKTAITCANFTLNGTYPSGSSSDGSSSSSSGASGESGSGSGSGSSGGSGDGSG